MNTRGKGGFGDPPDRSKNMHRRLTLLPETDVGPRRRCSFCKRGDGEVRRLIAGPDHVYICEECVELCRETIELVEAPISQADSDMRQSLDFVDKAQATLEAGQEDMRLASPSAPFLAPELQTQLAEAIASVRGKIQEYLKLKLVRNEADNVKSTNNN